MGIGVHYTPTAGRGESGKCHGFGRIKGRFDAAPPIALCYNHLVRRGIPQMRGQGADYDHQHKVPHGDADVP